MEIRLGPRAKAMAGLEEEFAKQAPSRGNEIVMVRLIGLRRHLPQKLVVSILKERSEGAGDDAIVPV